MMGYPRYRVGMKHDTSWEEYSGFCERDKKRSEVKKIR